MTTELKLFAVSSYYGNYHEVAASDADEAYGIASNYFERHHMGMVVAVQEIADRTAPVVKPEFVDLFPKRMDPATTLPFIATANRPTYRNPVVTTDPVFVRLPKLGWPIDPWLDNWIKEQIKIAHETIRDKPGPKET